MNRIAVFTRNHSEYLDTACEIANKYPGRPVAFRSSLVWARIGRALDEQESVRVYFAPVGGKGVVDHVATVKEVVLNPKLEEVRTQAALKKSLPGRAHEGLWPEEGAGVHTLYVIANCRKLDRVFPMTELIKESDGKPISENYGYSYVPVLEPVLGDCSIETYPGEIVQPELYPEGSVRKIYVEVYERNDKARARCIKEYGHNCAVCDFDFKAVYGEIGDGFIHVHHLRPLNEIDGEYDVDPVVDLRPVCPNCHAMIHKRNPAYAIDEMKTLIAQQIASNS